MNNLEKRYIEAKEFVVNETSMKAMEQRKQQQAEWARKLGLNM